MGFLKKKQRKHLRRLLLKTLNAGKTFTFQDKRLRYFYGSYNNTWKNERAVEIPIVKYLSRGYDSSETLEVGNVFRHYFRQNHTVLDKYEKNAGIINEDIVDFRPGRKYSLIFSISTMEHVGYDENARDSQKILRGIENMKSLLNGGGKIILTLPLGYNPFLDRLLREGSIRFSRIHYLKRISQDNKWIETTPQESQNAKYGFPYPGANVLVIGVIY